MDECDCAECCGIRVGPQGYLGAQGMACCGSQGPIGVQGTIAYGAQGLHGFEAPIVIGFQGFGGAQGAAADAIVVPNAGADGSRGFQGTTDSQGPEGFVGDVGAQGFIGGTENVGPQGFQAPGLLDGFQGFQGDRISGPQGPTGAQGVGWRSAHLSTQGDPQSAEPGSAAVVPSFIVLARPAFIRVTAHVRFLTPDPVAFSLYNTVTMAPQGPPTILTMTTNIQTYLPLVIARNVPAGRYALGFTPTTSNTATIEPTDYSYLVIYHY